MALGNGVSEGYGFNSRLQPASITAINGGTTLLSLANYYCPSQQSSCTSNNGNVLSQTITRPEGAITQTFGYDAVNRLSSASATTPWSQTYDYDRWGNRSASGTLPSALLTPGSFSAATNRVADSGYSFDLAGNLTAYATRTLAYDAENRQKTLTESGTTFNYYYDGEGRRVKKVANEGTTVYVYDAAGQLAAEYSDITNPESGTQYLTADHLGSTRLVTDATGAVVHETDYFPFGEEIDGGDWFNPKFTAKLRDYESGLNLDYFGARYYAGAQGRFTSVDPENRGGMVPDPQSWNGYAYGRNNPLKYVDPDGERYRVCDSDGKNCADISDQEFYDFQQQNKNLFSFTGKGQILNNGNLTGTFQQTSVDLDPLAALVLRSAGETADREIKQFAKDVAISTATGFVLGGVFQGAQAAGRLLPFKDARLIQRVSNVLDELASGRRSFQKAREFLNDARAGGQALPAKGPGYYREFTVQPAPGVSGRGAERLVVGQGGEVYYTPNHYGSFVRIQ